MYSNGSKEGLSVENVTSDFSIFPVNRISLVLKH